MGLLDDFAPGSLVWCKDPAGKIEWEEGRVVSATATTIDVEIESATAAGKSFVTVEKHASKVIAMHQTSVDGVNDMITLQDLHEGSLLRNLRCRFATDVIYTYTGTILVAVNPYKPIPLYGQDKIAQYTRQKIGSLSPHIFALADDAYSELMETRRNKSMLISGESGAGKTESTKLILQYLTHLSGARSHIEQLLIESSPILEAFGNATTSMNNNSSRFGKYMEVFFSRTKGTIIGGRIKQYLLEKSRIVMQPHSDRNYHVFYQLLLGSTPEEKKRYRLMTPESYPFIRNPKLIKVAGVNDQQDFQTLKAAMSVVGFSEGDVENIFRIVAAVLNLGRIQFNTREDGIAQIVKDNAVELAALLLKVEEEELVIGLTFQTFKTGRDNIAKALSSSQATATVATLAKVIYVKLFNWIVSMVNKFLRRIRKQALPEDPEADEESDDEMDGKDESAPPSIGVLDIFGFEVMTNNGFEQLCINLANETIQKFFNNRIFQLEQAEYEREGIRWDRINFTDNSECLKLLYQSKLSLLNLLDEETYFPNGTDDSLVSKFHTNHGDNPLYQKPKGSKQLHFSITHYAGKVTYECNEFLEKNQDILNDSIIKIFANCRCPVLDSLFAPYRDEMVLRNTIKKGTKHSTVIGQFKDSLNALMNTLETTDPYFIRCIKPNLTKSPNEFNRDLVLAQLRYTGMLETIRIRSLGYPLRQDFKTLWARYFMLLPKSQVANLNIREKVSALIKTMKLTTTDYQIGKTMMFMRRPAQLLLDDERQKKIKGSVVILEYFFLRCVCRLSFLEKRAAMIVIQCAVKGFLQRLKYKRMKMSSIKIQSVVRGHLQRKRFAAVRQAIPSILSAIRAHLFRAELYRVFLLSERRKEQSALMKRRMDDITAAKKLIEERERLIVQVELKKKQAVIENPGFKVVGLIQEMQQRAKDSGASPPKDDDIALFDKENKFHFPKFVSAYCKAQASIEYSEDVPDGCLLSRLSNEKDAAKTIFESVVKFVRASSRSTETECLEKLCMLSNENVAFRDELYCQMIKYTYGNPDTAVILRVWYMMSLCLGFLPPSDSLESYLLNFVERRGPEGYASFTQQIIKRCRLHEKPRSQLPCSIEHESCLKRSPIMLDISVPNSKVNMAVDSYMTFEELSNLVAAHLNVIEPTGFCVAINDAVYPNDAYVLDVLAEVESKRAKWQLSFFKELFFPFEPYNKHANSIIIDQIAQYIHSGMSDIVEDDLIYIGVLRFMLNKGDSAALQQIKFTPGHSTNLWIPDFICKTQEPEYWRMKFGLMFEDLKGMDLSVENMQLRIIQQGKAFPLLFGRKYAVEQKSGNMVTKKAGVNMIVNRTGIHLFVGQRNQKNSLFSFDYNTLVRLDADGAVLTIQVDKEPAMTFSITNGLASDMKDFAVGYMRELKSSPKFVVSLKENFVTDPLLLSFPKGAIIQVNAGDTAPGWIMGECNGEEGMIPIGEVEGLVGEVAPVSKEALMFQIGIGITSPIAIDPGDTLNRKRLHKLVPSAAIKKALPEKPLQFTGMKRSISTVLEEKYNFLDFARQYFTPRKVSKTKFKFTTTKKGKNAGNQTGQIFGTIKFKDGHASGQNILAYEEENDLNLIMFSSEPLKQPLLSYVQSKRMMKLAQTMSLTIMRCMGDYPSKKTWRDNATLVVVEGIQNEEIRDEIFCQIIKQLNGNTQPESVQKGWWLLNLCVGSFPPSELFLPYLRQCISHGALSQHLYRSIAEAAEAKLDRCLQSGIRQYGPTDMEFEGLEKSRPLVMKVYFPDNSSRSFTLDSNMTAIELMRKIYKKLDSIPELWAGCCLYVVTDAFDMSIPEKACVFDALAAAGVVADQYKLVFKKKLWLGKEETSSDALNNLIYHQILPSYLKGLLVCPFEDSQERLQETAFLAALQFKASGDDQSRSTEMIDSIQKYIPEFLWSFKSREQWTQTAMSAFTSLLGGKTQANARSIFLDIVRQWPFYGCSFFNVRPANDPSENLIMCLGIKGIYIVDSVIRKPIVFYKMGEIASWTHGPQHFSMKINDLQSGEKLIWFTMSGEEITDLLEEYINLLLEQKKNRRKG